MTMRRHFESRFLRQPILSGRRGTLLGGVSAFGIIVTMALALGATPALARTKNKALHLEADRTVSDPFGASTNGTVNVTIDIELNN